MLEDIGIPHLKAIRLEKTDLQLSNPQPLQLGGPTGWGGELAMSGRPMCTWVQLDLREQWDGMHMRECPPACCSCKLSCTCMHALACHSHGPIPNRSRPGSGPWPGGWGPLSLVVLRTAAHDCYFVQSDLPCLMNWHAQNCAVKVIKLYFLFLPQVYRGTEKRRKSIIKLKKNRMKQKELYSKNRKNEQQPSIFSFSSSCFLQMPNSF